MIVFPLRRSFGFKAATASSRVETLPMFVRSRPSRTPLDDLTQLGTIGLDNEVDCQAVGGPRIAGLARHKKSELRGAGATGGSRSCG